MAEVRTPLPACGAGAPALTRLVGDHIADFASEHWDRAPLLVRAAELERGFTDLLSSAAVDEMVLAHGLRQPFFRMVDHATPVTGLTRTAMAGNRTIGDLADPDALSRAYATGATLVLQSLHRTWPPIEALCRALSGDLGHQTQCNAYVTPAGDAQGFDYHHDTHDVFVLQVEGSKHWEVHQPVVTLPTKEQPRAGADLVEAGRPPLIDTVLGAGDVLYLPRGYVHAARTTDDASLHLTVGVIATTLLDILRDCVDQLGREELDLRRALPVGDAGADDAGRLLAVARGWMASVTSADVDPLLRRRRERAQAPEPIGMTAQAAAARGLGPTTSVRPRRGLDRRVEVEGDRVVIVLPDLSIRLPAVAEAMVRRALDGPTTPATVVAGDPDCDVADALVVLRRLLREGVLVVDDDAP